MFYRYSLRNEFSRCFVFAVVALSAVCLNFGIAGAQQTPTVSNGALPDEHFAPGQVVSSGKNAAPLGPLRVKTYRLERVKLAKPFERVELDGTKHRIETVFRLTITLGSPPAHDYFIWVDDVPWLAYPSGYETINGENSISVLLSTPTVPFEDGSSLAISTFSRKFELTTLPEKLMVPLDVRTKPVADSARMRIMSICSGVIIAGKEYRRIVWFTISSPIAFPIMNDIPILHIWDKAFQGGAHGYEASFMMGAEEFARLKDGAQVILSGPIGGVAGRLNKSGLDR